MTSAKEVARALHSALETGDVRAITALLADDAVVWHNSDRAELPRDCALTRLAGLAQVAENVRVETVRLAATEFGFVEQIVLHGTVKATGNPLELHNCLVVAARDGLIVRIDEYVDPNAATQVDR